MRRVSTQVIYRVRTGFLLFLDEELGVAPMDSLISLSMPSARSEPMSSVIDVSSPQRSSLGDCCHTHE